MNMKKALCIELDTMLDIRIQDTNTAIEATMESRDSESKSSAGDKYETGREMIQIELGKYQDQLEKYIKLKKAISQIDAAKNHSTVGFGSLVRTNQGNYFVSVGLGMVVVRDEKYFAISLASPIGNALEGQKADSVVRFQDREIKILEVQ